MHHPLRCRCGTIRGHVRLPATTGRAICYCKDCQSYARFLGRAEDILDEAGGSDVVATLPRQVRFEQGLESLACMSLSEGGILRWYADCCKTPIGNTPRNYKTSYVGLLHSCLSSASMEHSFGPPKVRVNTRSARRPVRPTPVATAVAILKLMRSVLPARLSGRYRENPFFHAQTGAPIRQPRVLSPAERSSLRNAA